MRPACRRWRIGFDTRASAVLVAEEEQAPRVGRAEERAVHVPFNELHHFGQGVVKDARHAADAVDGDLEGQI